MSQTLDPANIQHLLEVLERLGETFRLYEHAAAVAQQQLAEATAEAARIRAEAAEEVDRLQTAALAERDQFAAEVEALRQQRDRLRDEIARTLREGEARKRQAAQHAAMLARQAQDLLASLGTLAHATDDQPGRTGWGDGTRTP